MKSHLFELFIVIIPCFFKKENQIKKLFFKNKYDADSPFLRFS